MTRFETIARWPHEALDAWRRRASSPVRMASVARLLAVACALTALGVFVHHALDLARYPFDWDPGEGTNLAVARRLLGGPARLYPNDTVVPVPFTYGPLLPALLAPVIALAPDHPLLPARLLLLCVALAIAGGVYALVRRQSGRALSLAFAGLSLAPFGSTFWFVLVRVDALLIALWLWAAVVVLPERLQQGVGRLGWPRAAGGAALLVAAVLAKPTAVLLGAPLVLGWLLVDPPSALRLGMATLALGGASFAGLQLGTHGGFWWTLALQTHMSGVEGQSVDLILGSLLRYRAAAALSGVGLAVVLARRDGSARDGALLLWLSGPVSLPLLAKSGANFAYLAPWGCALVVLAGRWLGRRSTVTETRRLDSDAVGGLLCALAAATTALLERPPLPTEEDRRTAAAFYAFVERRGAPIVAAHPDYAYYVVGEDVLLEPLNFSAYAAEDLPGARAVFDRIDRLEYRLIVENLSRWRFPPNRYVPVGVCHYAFYYGTEKALLLVPPGDVATAGFEPPLGARCAAIGSLPASSPR